MEWKTKHYSLHRVLRRKIFLQKSNVMSRNVWTFLYRLLKEAFLFLLKKSKGLERQLQLQTARSLTKNLVIETSRRKWACFLKVLEEQKKQRNEAVLKEDYSSESIIQEDMDEMSHEMLDFTLASFVAEVRKEHGPEYPEK